MSVDKLLIPRYEVIGEYPNSKLNIGNILVPINSENIHFDCLENILCDTVRSPEKYPHLFKRLEWYEKREVNDMPKYLKIDLNNDNSWKYHKVEKWNIPFAYIKEKECYCLGPLSNAYQYLPISEEEYLKNVSND